MNKLTETSIYAREQLDKHGLSNWNINLIKPITKKLVYTARTLYHNNTIEIMIPYILKCDFFKIKNTILHEISHAIVGKNHGHDDIWKNKAIEIGCDGLETIKIK